MSVGSCLAISRGPDVLGWGMAGSGSRTPQRTSHGVPLSSLDTEVFDQAGVTKGELIDYLEAMADHLVAELSGRPLSVIRARPGSPPFMQKNLPKYAPDWIPTHTAWAETSHRDVHYPLVEEARTLMWLGNQRAVEFHPSLWRVGEDQCRDLVIDLDPPGSNDPDVDFAQAAAAAVGVRQALADCGLTAQVKTSGAKGVHIVVPLVPSAFDDVAAATRALADRAASHCPEVATTEFVRDRREGKVFVDSTRAGGATLVAAWSPRARPGLPVSFPVDWDELTAVRPGDFTVRTVPGLTGGADRWRDGRPADQELPSELVAEGHSIPIARVVAMHEGKRRKRAEEPRL